METPGAAEKPLDTLGLDVLVCGGGAAGLWLLDELTRNGFSALLVEAHCLGSGQTICSQGIIHGGIKYSLSGLLNPSATAIKEMPRLWRKCLSGTGLPDLRETRVASPCCYLWRTQEIGSRLGLAGARAGLETPFTRGASGRWAPE